MYYDTINACTRRETNKINFFREPTRPLSSKRIFQNIYSFINIGDIQIFKRTNEMNYPVHRFIRVAGAACAQCAHNCAQP